MAQYNVTPVGAGSTRWKVERNGAPIARANTQSNAIDKAYDDGRAGDSLTIHKRNGQIRERRTMR